MRKSMSLLAIGAATLMLGGTIHAQTITREFAENYEFDDLGSVPGVPTPLGGVTFKYDDPNVMLIGGNANNSAGAIYAVNVIRDCENHVEIFDGEATLFATAPGIDGGLTYGPNDVLFFTTFSTNTLGQILPGSTEPDKIMDLSAFGIASSTGTVQFVPDGFGGAGSVKILSYSASQWYSADLVPDGNGTYDLDNVTSIINVGGGPEGLVYIAGGNPQFDNDSVLISEYSGGSVGTWEIDLNGDPVPDTRRTFITGLSGAEGAAIDPLTGDFVFSTFGGGNRVIIVDGFNDPEPCDADFNGDQSVDAADLAALLSTWGECPNCPTDLTGDCEVGAGDLAVLLSLWGDCE